MTALCHLHAAGVLLGLLVVLNLFVPARYGWRDDLSRLSLLNRQIFQVHAIFIVVVLAMLSGLLLCCAPALLEPAPLSRAVLSGLTAFWGLRLYMQFCFYDPRIWRGKRFETAMHVVFSLLWIYLVAVFGTVLAMNLRM
jgi:hypothetical protein